jgi:hypothetical protein
MLTGTGLLSPATLLPDRPMTTRYFFASIASSFFTNLVSIFRSLTGIDDGATDCPSADVSRTSAASAVHVNPLMICALL